MINFSFEELQTVTAALKYWRENVIRPWDCGDESKNPANLSSIFGGGCNPLKFDEITRLIENLEWDYDTRYDED